MRLKYYIQGFLTLILSLAILWIACGSDIPRLSYSNEHIDIEYTKVADESSQNKAEETLIISGMGWKNDNELTIYVSDIDSEKTDDIKVEAIDSKGNWDLKYPFNRQHFGPIITFKVVGQQSGVESSAVFNNETIPNKRKSKLASIFSI